jgi:hypothetical protein
MIVLGIILALIGYFATIPVLLWIGIVLLVIGLIVNFVPLGGSTRRWY